MFSEPTGRTMTPLSEIAYIIVAAAFKTACPTISSGIEIRSRKVRLAASMITMAAGKPGVVVVEVVPDDPDPDEPDPEEPEELEPEELDPDELEPEELDPDDEPDPVELEPDAVEDPGGPVGWLASGIWA